MHENFQISFECTISLLGMSDYCTCYQCNPKNIPSTYNKDNCFMCATKIHGKYSTPSIGSICLKCTHTINERDKSPMKIDPFTTEFFITCTHCYEIVHAHNFAFHFGSHRTRVFNDEVMREFSTRCTETKELNAKTKQVHDARIQFVKVCAEQEVLTKHYTRIISKE